MKHYLFFGNTPKLSLQEAQAVLGDVALAPYGESLGIVGHDIKAQAELDKLGGTTKIAALVRHTTPETLEDDLFDIVRSSASKRFVVTDLGRAKVPDDLAYRLKERVSEFRNVRFLSFKLDSHSLVAIKKQHITELNILDDDEGMLIAETIAVHNFQEWAARDRKKPYRNIKKGMMPPKLARMMVNIASHGKDGCFLADPFCGTGTISMEAAFLGHSVVASDLSSQAVAGTQQNLHWMSGRYGTDIKAKVFVSDATQLHTHLDHIDCVATEPFMGDLIEDREGRLYQKGRPLTPVVVKNVIRGLDKLYTGALKSWHRILPEGGRVVMIMPEFRIGENSFRPGVIDLCEKIGYNLLITEAYAKPNATIVRLILTLEKR